MSRGHVYTLRTRINGDPTQPEARGAVLVFVGQGGRAGAVHREPFTGASGLAAAARAAHAWAQARGLAYHAGDL